VIALHTVTTLEAAPLGRPSWAGFEHGAIAVVRVGLSLLGLILWRRSLGLGEVTAALGWWFGPLRPFGVDPRRIGIVLTVALGTVPRALADGRRIIAVQRLRRVWCGPDAAERPATASVRYGGRWSSWRDQARIVVPLLEGVLRRGDALSLALRGRQQSPPLAAAPRIREWFLLLVWATALVAAALRAR
jgi:energy-coupling factor transporter transmembrane protein EcfT